MFPEIPGLSPEQVKLLERHFELLLRWNKVLNLTSVRDPKEAIERHYRESLFLGEHLPPGELRIADIGSGAGFPGFPVAVLRPDCHVTLIESHQRKAVFLREASRGIGNVTVVARRADEVTEMFDWGISRAVSYIDLAWFLIKKCRNAALLTGDVRAEDMPGFQWQEPITLPWGERRWLFIGRNSSFSA